MFWLCLYYLKALVALLALPFLAFGVPVLGTILRAHTVGPLSPLSPSHGLFRGQTRLA